MHLFTSSCELNDTTEIILCKMKLYQRETTLPKTFLVGNELGKSQCAADGAAHCCAWSNKTRPVSQFAFFHTYFKWYFECISAFTS